MEIGIPANKMLALISIISLIIIGTWILTSMSTAKTIAPPGAIRGMAQSNGSATGIKGDAQPCLSSGLCIYIDNDLYKDERTPLSTELSAALAYVKKEGGFVNEPSAPFRVALVNDSGCGLRGLADIERRTVQVFTCNSIPRSRAVTILAHEFVHQLAADRYGDAEQKADTILAEGMATWAADKYWLGQFPDFRSYVRAQRAAGSFFPLRSRVINTRSEMTDGLYYEWASFVDYLIDTYGPEKFDQLYRTGSNSTGSADYLAVYGVGFDKLEQQWLDWIGT